MSRKKSRISIIIIEIIEILDVPHTESIGLEISIKLPY